MALYKVKKTPLKNLETDAMLQLGDVIERRVKDVEEFEKKNGNGYLERLQESTKDDKKEKDDEKEKTNTSTTKK